MSRPERVDPSAEYRLLGAHWYAKGLYVKAIEPGSRIRSRVLYAVKAGDFVYNRLFAWMGAFARASDDQDGCYVSNEFMCFRPKADVDPEFVLEWLRRPSFWKEAEVLSTGSTPTSRNRLKVERFLQMNINLPELERQRAVARTMGQLEDIAKTATDKTSSLRHSCTDLLRSMLACAVERSGESVRFGDVLQLRNPDVEVELDQIYEFAGVFSFGRGLFRGGSKAGDETAYRRLTRLSAGEFVYPKLMAWEGAFAVVPDVMSGLHVSPEFPVFSLNDQRVLPETLEIYFRDPAHWALVAGASPGTNVRRRRLHPKVFLNRSVLLPSLNDQRMLSNVKAVVDRYESGAARRGQAFESLVAAARESSLGAGR